MTELQVTEIENESILPTDRLYGFSQNESKAPTVDTVVKSTPGILALGVCETEAAEGNKEVTSPNWKGVPGESILIEFSETNSANEVYISINEGTALPVYPLNSNVIAAGSVIHSGAMLFTLSSDGSKLWAIVIALKTFDNQELAGNGNIDLGYYLNPIVNSIPTKVSDLQNDTGFVSSVPTKVSDLENDTGFITGSDNAASATKLKTARTIAITDADGTNSGTSISFDGTANKTLKLPSTIKASITGNCSGSSGSCTGNAATATTANRIRTSTPSSLVNGDVWIG